MSHSGTEQLIEYWRSRRSGSGAPTRSAIDPAAFPKLLPQVFMLGRRGPGDYVFRLAGGLLREMHQRDLRGAAFTSLWADEARLPVQAAMERARRQVEPLRVKAYAPAGFDGVELTIGLVPVANDLGEIDRVLGVYEPKTSIEPLHGVRPEGFVLLGFGSDDAQEHPYLRLAAVGGQRVG